MDTIHAWALWRLLMLALIALPFLVAVVVVGFRQGHADGRNAVAEPSSPIAGPGAWRKEGNARFEARSVDDAVAVEQRAA
jgi:hypothetical protein